MRVKLRIRLSREGKRLRKKDFEGLKDPLSVGMRYITEFKYLEATKWLLIAQDCWEKYTLLYLINLSLGQEEQAREFLSHADIHPRITDVNIEIETPSSENPSELKSQTFPY